MLRIHLLGRPHFLIGSEPRELTGLPKTWALWAYLLLHHSHPVKRETLAYTLWPDEPEASARANLRRHLHDLKRILPPPPASGSSDWLLVDARTIQWNPECDYWLDVTEFERLSASAGTLAEAVALYGGDFLESSYDDWLFYERERLRDLYLVDLNQLTSSMRDMRDYSLAAVYAHRMLEIDPFREDALRHLMSVRYEGGDRNGALQAYEQFARRLREELGVDPMPETASLREAVIRHAPLPGVRGEEPGLASSTPENRVESLLLPFVGRDAELEQLRGWWSRAARGKGGLVMLGGEAGIGKTRLATQLGSQVEAEGARILLGNTTFTEPLPYQALASALRSALPLVAALDIEPLWLAAVASVIPDVRARRGEGPGRLPALMPLDPERERSRLFEGLARCLEGLAQPRPLLVILEDLHWAGAATASLLEFLARHVAQHAVLIVATYREEETLRAHPLRDLRRRLQREGVLRHLALGPLSQGALESLVAQMPRLGSATGSLAHDLYLESEGQPFFLSELIRDLLEGETGPTRNVSNAEFGIRNAEYPNGEWEIENAELPPNPVPFRIPNSTFPIRDVSLGVRTLIAARMSSLSPEARSLAEVASVVGTAFTVELVREISGRDEAGVLDSLDELLDRGLVSEVVGRSQADYSFTHHLIQTAIYAEMPPALAVRRHRRLAQVMEEIYPERHDELAGQLALHFDLGHERDKAASYYLQAALVAASVFASEEALRHIVRALELSDEPATQFGLLALRESINSRLGDRVAQQSDLSRLEVLAEALAGEDAICEVLLRRVLLQRLLGERRTEADLILALKQRALASGSIRWQAEAFKAEADYRVLLSQYDSARAALEQALQLRRRLKDPTGQAECYALLSEVAAYAGHFKEAQRMLKQAISVEGSEANRSLLVRTLRAASIAAIVQVEIDTAYKLGLQMLELCGSIGDREGEADAHTRVATAASRLFHVEEARSHYEHAEALYAMLGNRRGQAAVLVNAGILAANLGHYIEAISASRNAEELFRGLNDPRGQTVSLVNIASHSLRHGEYKVAQAAGARALKLARSMGNPVLEAYALANLGAAERELGQSERAIAHMEAGLSIRRSIGEAGQTAIELATDLCDLTVAYLRAGMLPAAQRAANEMLDLMSADPVHMTYPQFILWAAAQTYHALGQDERAGELITGAYQALQEKGAAIPDRESRETFARLPFNRELTSAYETGRWP